MSDISTELTKLSANINGAYASLETRGSEFTGDKTAANLTAAVEKIPADKFLGIANGKIVLDLSGYSLDSTLTANQYRGLLSTNNTDVTNPPSMPATELTENCYQALFWNCPSLSSAPVLPATTLATFCYNAMFYGCSSLSAAPELPAETLASYCYSNMFQSCSKLSSAPELPATTLATYCYNAMFYGCSSLSAAPELPATTLATHCYEQMFWNCKSLTAVPELPATTLVSSCYQYMFADCPLVSGDVYIHAEETSSDTAMVGMFLNNSNDLTLHFKPTFASVLTSMQGYGTFGAMGTVTIAYDIA